MDCYSESGDAPKSYVKIFQTALEDVRETNSSEKLEKKDASNSETNIFIQKSFWSSYSGTKFGSYWIDSGAAKTVIGKKASRSILSRGE